MDCRNDDKDKDAESEQGMSNKKELLEIDRYGIRREVIKKSEDRKDKNRIEKKAHSRAPREQGSSYRNEKREEIEERREDEEIFCNGEMHFHPFQWVGKKEILQVKKGLVRVFILDFIHKFI